MPSRHIVLSWTRTRPSGRSWTRCWASGGSGRAVEAGAVVGGDPDIGVEIEAIELGLAGAAGGGVTGVRLVAEAADAGAGPWPQRDAALDGGADEASQNR